MILYYKKKLLSFRLQQPSERDRDVTCFPGDGRQLGDLPVQAEPRERVNQQHEPAVLKRSHYSRPKRRRSHPLLATLDCAIEKYFEDFGLQ